MNLFGSSRFFRSTAIAIVCLVAGGGAARADDSADVKATIAAFHQALASLDVAKMEALWAHDDTVMDKEPNAKSTTLGWTGTRKNFEDLFAAASAISAASSEGPNVQVKGDIAYSTGVARSEATFKKFPAFSADIYEADVFQKRDGKWVYVVHAAYALPK
jgi:ketosteroid isomerase-like protein